MKTITLLARNLLADVQCYLSQLEDYEYSTPLPLLSDASIGQHTRHLLGGYTCLMRQANEGKVNYDLRNRDPRMETETGFVLQEIDTIDSFLQNVDCCTPIEMYGTFDQSHYSSKSSLSRELVHNIDHTIHHLAIIKIGLKAYYDHVLLPESFGVAPSTLAYRQTNEVQVK